MLWLVQGTGRAMSSTRVTAALTVSMADLLYDALTWAGCSAGIETAGKVK